MLPQLILYTLAASTVATAFSVKQPDFIFVPENGSINDAYAVSLYE